LTDPGCQVDQVPANHKRALAELLLTVADDKFILGHRNADWTGLAPILEEDIAYSSMAQDEIAHASAFYDMAANLLGTTANRLAYGRQAAEYRSAEITELSDEFDWAVALARSFYCDHFDRLRLGRLAKSSYRPLAQLAGRLTAEEQIHVDHVDSWLRRLGRGTEESRTRMEGALTRLAEPAVTLFETNDAILETETGSYYPGDEPSMFEEWSRELTNVAAQSGIRLSVKPPKAGMTGGRKGKHSSGFNALLDELTEVYRIEPEAAW
jgi:ring-1,2-phenylacetyl-CoA epoxidase subunit PaaC